MFVNNAGPFPALPKQLKQDIMRVRGMHSRRSRNLLLLEGKRLLSDALDQEVDLFYSVIEQGASEKHAPLLRRLHKAGVPVYVAGSRDFEQLSDTVHSQGILAVSFHEMPTQETAFKDWGDADLLVALDNVSDPGNLGTMIRTQDWFGMHSLLLSHGSVHPTNPKVVRATMGSLFRVRIAGFDTCQALIDEAHANNYSVAVASSSGGIDVFHWAPLARTVLLFGNEAHGLPSAVVEAADNVVTIPRCGRSESLNLSVAHGIIISHLSTLAAHAPSPALSR
jgi:RNA methyltransferase, TrmH family